MNPHAAREGRPRLLLVEADPQAGAELRGALEKEGYDVLLLTGPRQAAENFAGTFVPLAVIDVRRRGGPGLDLLSTIKERSPETEVIVVMGGASGRTAAAALERRAFACLTRPLEAGRLIPVLRQALTGQKDRADRRRLFDQVSHAKIQWETTVDAIQEMISIHDRSGRILRANRPVFRFLGVQPAQAIGRTFHEIAPEGGYPWDEDLHLSVLESRSPRTRDLRDISGDRIFRVSCHPALGPGGEILYTVYLAAEITEERRVLEESYQEDTGRILGEMASGIAQELSGPLTAIAGFCQLLAESDLAAAHRPDLEQIRSAASSCERAVRGLALVGPAAIPEGGVVAIGEVLAGIVRLRERNPGNRRIGLEVDLAPGLPAIPGDSRQIRQALASLIGAAAESIRRHRGAGTILVRITAHEGTVSCEIRDDGGGLSRRSRDRIFEPLFAAAHLAIPGSLGLAAARRIVEAHGGEIRVGGELGRGTTATVLLPVRPPAGRASGDPAPLPSPGWEGRRTVLLLSDDLGALEILSDVLAESRTLHEAARDAPTARLIGQSRAIQAAIIDVRERTGLPVAAVDALLASGSPIAPHIFFITGEGIQEADLDLWRSGRTSTDPRPITEREAREAVRLIREECW